MIKTSVDKWKGHSRYREQHTTDDTDIGMSWADPGTGLEMQKLLCSCNVWQAWAPVTAHALPAVVDPVLEAFRHLLFRGPGASSFSFKPHRLKKKKKKGAKYRQVWFSFSLEYSQLPSGSAAMNMSISARFLSLVTLISFQG